MLNNFSRLTLGAFLPVVLLAAPLMPAFASSEASMAGSKPAFSVEDAVPTETMSLAADEGRVLKLSSDATSIFVANNEVADVQIKSGKVLYIYGRRPGQTTFYAVDAADNVIVSRTVIVGLNLSALRNTIRKITGNDNVQVGQVEDMIVLSGQVENASVAQDLVKMATRYLPRQLIEDNQGDMVELGRNYVLNRMAVAGSNQVNIRVRIAEVAREATKTLGLNTNVANPDLFGDVDMSFGFDAGVSLAGAAGTGGLGTTWGATSITTALDALVEDGLATVLSEPNLTALSGETATFLAGGEFPIPVPNSDGDTTIEFREYGVRLSFTPTVLSGNRISMRVRPEVSDRDDSLAVSFSGGSIPGLRTRRTETSIELGSGQSFAIAGLIQNNTSQSQEKFPGLGDLPVIGALFRSDRFIHNQSELVIVVTPYLVKPVSANQVMLPTDGFVPPNDIDRWLNGRLNSEAPTPAAVPVSSRSKSAAGAGLVGDIGYELQ